jgi:hypothetical protein
MNIIHRSDTERYIKQNFMTCYSYLTLRCFIQLICSMLIVIIYMLDILQVLPLNMSNYITLHYTFHIPWLILTSSINTSKTLNAKKCDRYQTVSSFFVIYMAIVIIFLVIRLISGFMSNDIKLVSLHNLLNVCLILLTYFYGFCELVAITAYTKIIRLSLISSTMNTLNTNVNIFDYDEVNKKCLSMAAAAAA